MVTVQFFDAEIIEVEAEPLRAGEDLPRDFVEAGDVFIFAVLEKGGTPERPGRAVDQVYLRCCAACDEKIAPLEVAVCEAVRVHRAGGLRQLA